MLSSLSAVQLAAATPIPRTPATSLTARTAEPNHFGVSSSPQRTKVDDGEAEQLLARGVGLSGVAEGAAETITGLVKSVTGDLSDGASGLASTTPDLARADDLGKLGKPSRPPKSKASPTLDRVILLRRPQSRSPDPQQSMTQMSSTPPSDLKVKNLKGKQQLDIEQIRGSEVTGLTGGVDGVNSAARSAGDGSNKDDSDLASALPDLSRSSRPEKSRGKSRKRRALKPKKSAIKPQEAQRQGLKQMQAAPPLGRPAAESSDQARSQGKPEVSWYGTDVRKIAPWQPNSNVNAPIHALQKSDQLPEDEVERTMQIFDLQNAQIVKAQQEHLEKLLRKHMKGAPGLLQQEKYQHLINEAALQQLKLQNIASTLKQKLGVESSAPVAITPTKLGQTSQPKPQQVKKARQARLASSKADTSSTVKMQPSQQLEKAKGALPVTSIDVTNLKAASKQRWIEKKSKEVPGARQTYIPDGTLTPEEILDVARKELARRKQRPNQGAQPPKELQRDAQDLSADPKQVHKERIQALGRKSLNGLVSLVEHWDLKQRPRRASLESTSASQ